MYPDILIVEEPKPGNQDQRMKLFIGALTVPMEQNMNKRHEEKKKKYERLIQQIDNQRFDASLYRFEIGSLTGAISGDLPDLFKALKIKPAVMRDCRMNMRVAAVQSSSAIFNNRRNKNWSLDQ